MVAVTLSVFTRRMNRTLMKLSPPMKLYFSYAEGNYFVSTWDNSIPRQGPIYYKELADIATQIGSLNREEQDMGVDLITKHGTIEQVPYRYGQLALTRADYDAYLPFVNDYKAEHESSKAREAQRQVAIAAHIAKTDAIRAAKTAELQAAKLQAQREGRYVPTELEKLLDTGLTGIALNQHIERMSSPPLMPVVTAAVTENEITENEITENEVIDLTGKTYDELCKLMDEAEARGDYNERDRIYNAMPDMSDEEMGGP